LTENRMSEQAVSQPVVVIGAGIVGVSTAIWLQRAGIESILLDRGGPAAGTSFGNAGVLASASVVPVTVPGLLFKAPGMALDRQQPLFINWSYLPRMLPWLTRYLSNCREDRVRRIAQALGPILADSLADHQALAAGTGAEKYISPAEFLYLYRNRAHFEADRFGWQLRDANGFTWSEYEGAQLRRFDPVFSSTQNFAASVHRHGRISDPGQYVKTLAAHYEATGGRILTAHADDFVIEHNRITGVRIGGDTIHCSAAVVATGAWSKALMQKLNCSVPLEAERGYHIELYEPSAAPKYPTMIAEGKFVMTPMDGRLRIAGVVEFGGLVAGASRAPIDFLKSYIHRVLPDLSWTETREWLGHRPAPTDSVPVIGAVPGIQGAFVGFGHQHVGLTGGALTGRLLAGLIAGRPDEIEMSPYRVDRFHA
jgi:D-amino-acid dehydrogenase